jgi:hypothetical protein
MPFPLSARGHFNIDIERPAHLQSIVDQLADAIREQKPRSVRAEQNRINFKAGLFRRVNSLNRLGAITTGEISVESAFRGFCIRYKITFLQLLLVTTLLTFAFFLVLLATATVSLNSDAERFLIGFWLLVLCGNYFLSRVRFESFLREAAKRAVQQSAPAKKKDDASSEMGLQCEDDQ